jgi:hypothetical protein
MQIDERDEHFAIAHLPISESLDGLSNITLDKLSHWLKQLSPRTSTEDGMQIDESEEQNSNAPRSIRETFESLSNVTLESRRH